MARGARSRTDVAMPCRGERTLRVRAGVSMVLAAALVVGCSGGDARDASATSSTGSENSGDALPVPAADACELVTRDDAAAIMGVPAQVDEDSAGGRSDTNCHYVNVPPADTSEGQVLRQLQVQIYSGARYFDATGVVFPLDERESLDIGDEAFVHVSDTIAGVNVQVLVGDTVYLFSYSETAILAEEQADAGAKQDALVALVGERLGAVG